MVCLIRSKYLEEINQYTELLGSEKRAYAVLCCNNGYTLDRTKEGKPSKLYSDLLKLYNGDTQKAIQKKASYFTGIFTDKNGKWYEDDFEISDENKDAYDENGEPKVSEELFNVKEEHDRKPKIIRTEQHWLNADMYITLYAQDMVGDRYFLNKLEYDKYSRHSLIMELSYNVKLNEESRRRICKKLQEWSDGRLTAEFDNIDKGNTRVVIMTREEHEINKIMDKVPNARSRGISETHLVLTHIKKILKESGGVKNHENFAAVLAMLDDLCAYDKNLWGQNENKTLSNLRFRVVSSKDNFAAKYSSKTHTVYINKNAKYNNENGFTNSLAQTVVHEMLHAVTVEALDHNRAFRKRAENLLASLKEQHPLDEEIQNMDVYEMIAELSNDDFVEKLRNTKYYTGNRSHTWLDILAKSLKGVFKKFMSLIGKKYMNTAYDEAVDILLKAAYPWKAPEMKWEFEIDGRTEFNRMSAKERLREAEKSVRKIFGSEIPVRGERTSVERNVDNLIQTIEQSSLSKDKAYKSKSHIDSAVYGDERQVVANQETVRRVRENHKRIAEVVETGTAEEILTTKVEAVLDFIERAFDDLQSAEEMLTNAKANGFNSVYYNTGIEGERQYRDASDTYLTASTATSSTVAKVFTFDDIQYVTSDIIGYYDNILKSIELVITEVGDKNVVINQIKDFLNTSQLRTKLTTVNTLRLQAQEQLLDEYIEAKITEQESSELTPDMRRRLAINMKKWVNAQYDFGDTNSFMRVIGLLSDAKSPIARALAEEIYKMNMEVDEQTQPVANALVKLYEDAQKENSGFTSTKRPGNFLTQLMATDRRGLFTGDFVKPINERQYYQDLEDYKASLLYGKHSIEERIQHILGDKDFKLELDEYGAPIFPTCSDPAQQSDMDVEYKYYRREMEKFMCRYADRRYTEKYYLERIDHMSAITLRALDNINNQINELRKSCVVDGKFKPNLLSSEQRSQLAQLLADREELANPFDEEGEYKQLDTDEGQIAHDLMEWRKYMRDKIKYTTDEDAFNEALSNIHSATERALFKKQFSHVIINPLMYDALIHSEYVGNNPNVLAWYDELLQLSAEKRALLKRYDVADAIGKYKFDEIFDLTTGAIKKPGFIRLLGMLDKRINDIRTNIRVYRKANKEAHEKDDTIPYEWDVTRDGERWDDMFTDAYYGEKAINPAATGYDLVFGVKGSAYDAILTRYEQYLVSTGLSVADARRNAMNALAPGGMVLSVFSEIIPNTGSSTFKARDGSRQSTYKVVPSGMFSKVDAFNSSSEYVNYNYDESNEKFVQPKDEYYHDDRYDQMRSKPKLSTLYDGLISTMEDAYSKLPFLTQYDGRLPLIGGDSTMAYSRTNPFKAYIYNWNRKFNVNESDTELYTTGEIKRPDGTPIKNVPIQFVDRVDDAAYISSDIVSNVLRVAHMANNYFVKSQHVARIETILHNIKEHGGETSNSYQLMLNAVDRQIYGQKQKKAFSALDNKWWRPFDWIRRLFLGGSKTFTKRLGLTRAASQRISLAFRLISMTVSYLDPLISTLVEAGCGRYYNGHDLMMSVWDLTKEVFSAGYSIAKHKSYSRTMAIMDKLGMSGEMLDRYKNIYHTTARRFANKEWLMMGFEVGDYNIKALNTNAIFRNYRLYKDAYGNETFLNRDDFLETCMQDGMSLKEANKAYSSAIQARSCVKSKNGVLEFTHPAMTLEQFQKIGTVAKKVAQTVTLMSNANDKTDIQSNPWGAFITTLRVFMLVAINERFRSFDDFITGEYSDGVTTTPTDKQLSKKEVQELKKKHYYRGGYNFLTGRIENGVYTSGLSGLGKILTSWKAAKYWLSNFVFHYGHMTQEELKNADISKAEIYNALRILLELSAVVGCVALSFMCHKYVQGLDPDDDDNYWWFLLDAVMMRIGIERITMYNPSTLNDIITSVTTVSGAFSKVGRSYDLLLDMMGVSGHDPDEIIKSNSMFNGKSRRFRDLVNMGSYWGTSGYYSSMPKSVGGGGARALEKNASYYEKIAPWTRLYGDDASKRKGSNSGSGVVKVHHNGRGSRGGSRGGGR